MNSLRECLYEDEMMHIDVGNATLFFWWCGICKKSSVTTLKSAPAKSAPAKAAPAKIAPAKIAPAERMDETLEQKRNPVGHKVHRMAKKLKNVCDDALRAHHQRRAHQRSGWTSHGSGIRRGTKCIVWPRK